MLEYKFDVLERLKSKGWTQYRLKKERILGQQTLTDMKRGKVSGSATINTLCKLLDCQPGTLIKYVPDDENDTENSVE